DRVWAEGTDTSTSTFPLRWGPRNALNGNNGIADWCNAKQHHSAWVQKVSGGFGIDWPSTKGHHWGVGASVEGIGIGMETDYTTITDVTYTAGKGKFSHWIWGQKGNPYRYDLGGKFGSDPEVIYAYDLPNGNSACL